MFQGHFYQIFEACVTIYSKPAFLFFQVCKQSGLSFIHQNICGLHSNFESLSTVIATHDIDIITLSETFPTQTDCTKLKDMLYFVTSRRERGVCVFIKNNIQRRNVKIENVWVEIFFQTSHSPLLCCVYRPPDSSLNKFQQ